MGKSDPYVFDLYRRTLDGFRADKIACLGFSSDDDFTRGLGGKRDLFDRSLSNWDINSEWSLGDKYELIVCTRCAFFSKNPVDFLERCERHLFEEGKLLIDWGLGDHWRFSNYKIGWTRNGEHEYAYSHDNLLHSTMWLS